MGVLDTVLEYKKQKEARAAADLNAIPQALTTFTAARQVANQNTLDQLKVRSELATHGLELFKTPEGAYDFRRRADLMDPTKSLDTINTLLGVREKAAEQGVDLSQFGYGGGSASPAAPAPAGARPAGPAAEAPEDENIVLERNMFGVPTKTTTKGAIQQKEKAQELGTAAGKAAVQATGMKTIEEDLDAILGDWKEINASNRGPIQGRTKGVAAKFLQTDPALVNYEDSRGLILANISREFGGEKGVLTDADIKRIEKSLPLLRDTDDVAGRKIKFVKSFIARKIAAKDAVSKGATQSSESSQESAPTSQDSLIDAYQKKYPNRTRQEIMAALKKQRGGK